ncbi:MAG: hypothetical protein O2931_10070 [Planctomycetota bacterium]|nr:hypothetical protein [Planctomycetota bacterium]MDA1179127.1 hypothetical protein [Planctomycetota bacterium]
MVFGGDAANFAWQLTEQSNDRLSWICWLNRLFGGQLLAARRFQIAARLTWPGKGSALTVCGREFGNEVPFTVRPVPPWARSFEDLKAVVADVAGSTTLRVTVLAAASFLVAQGTAKRALPFPEFGDSCWQLAELVLDGGLTLTEAAGTISWARCVCHAEISGRSSIDS